MPQPIDREIVADRLMRFPSESYAFLGNIIKGVVLAVSTSVLLTILLDWDNLKSRLVPWVASMAAAAVSHATWGRGTLMSNSRFNFCDVVFPMGMGIAEFLLFAILSVDAKAHPDFHFGWFIVLAAHGFLATGLVANRIVQHKQVDFDEFDKEFSDLGKKFRGWLWRDLFGTIAVGTLATGVGLTIILWVLPKFGEAKASQIELIASAAFVLILSGVVVQASSQRKEIDRVVSRPKPPSR